MNMLDLRPGSRPTRSARWPGLETIGLSDARTAQPADFPLPEGTTLISSDSHFSVWDDIWVKRTPKRLHERMPRVWYDAKKDIWNIGQDGVPIYPEPFHDLLRSMEGRPGAGDLPRRLEEMDAEGIQKDVAFPQTIQRYFTLPDLEVREWIYRAYNEYVAELAQQAPDRFFPVGIATFWDGEKAARSVEAIKGLGLKSYMIPILPGAFEDGTQITYACDRMRPFWEAAEDADMPVCFHIGESLKMDGPGALGTLALANFGPFRRSFGELMFGGIFDRHPRLRIVFAEAQINWVPGMLQDAEMFQDTFNRLLTPQPQTRAGDYWRRHCYTTFTFDNIGLEMLDYVGADRVLWASDYPHNESSFGCTGQTVKAVMDRVSAQEARMILGGSAAKVFKL